MKSFLLALLLVLTACGGSTATTTDAAEDTTTAATSDESADDDAASADESALADDADAETDDASTSGMVDDSDDDSDDDTTTVSAFDDIPEVCRDLMEDFLKEIEPLVSPIDWDNASLADFESIGAEFEARAEQFEAETDTTEECENIELEDDENFDLMIEFAQDKAPGTVGFLTFIDGFADAATTAITGDSPGAASFEDCEGAIAFMDDLMNRYDTVEEVPVSEITALAELATVIFTCSPDQMQYFDSQEVNDFFGSFVG